MPPTISHPRDPLLALLRDGQQMIDAAFQAFLPSAKAIVADHRSEGTSAQSVYAVESGGGPYQVTWRRIGAAEQHGHLLGQGSEYHTITDHTDPRDLVLLWAPADTPTRGVLDRARRLLPLSDQAATIIEAVLALCVTRSGLVWETDETIAAAAHRLTRVAAVRIAWSERPCCPREVFRRTLDDINVVNGPAAGYARSYLDARGEINDALLAHGITWGGIELTRTEAAKRARVEPSSWSAYVTRGQAPEPDTPGTRPLWRLATIDAYRLQREDTRWWDIEPDPDPR